MSDAAADTTRLHVLETVRCLECGEVYAKPGDGGTVAKNPGCPSCGYVGWLPVSLPSGQRRFGAGLRRHRTARPR